MILKSEDNNTLIAMCNCGCQAALKFEISKDLYEEFGDYFIITPLKSGTDDDKIGPVYTAKDFFAHMSRFAKNERTYRFGIVMTSKELETIRDWMELKRDEAIASNVIPKEESFTSVFVTELNSDDGIMLNKETNESLFMSLDPIFEENQNEGCELGIYEKRESYDRMKSFIGKLKREIKPTTYFVRDLTLSKNGFINFARWLCDIIDIKTTIQENEEVEECETKDE